MKAQILVACLLFLPITSPAQNATDAEKKAAVAAAEAEILRQKIQGDDPTFLVEAVDMRVKSGPRQVLVHHYRPKNQRSIRSVVQLKPLRVHRVADRAEAGVRITAGEARIVETIVRNTLFVRRVMGEHLAKSLMELKLSVEKGERIAYAMFKGPNGSYFNFTVKVDLRTWQLR